MSATHFSSIPASFAAFCNRAGVFPLSKWMLCNSREIRVIQAVDDVRALLVGWPYFPDLQDLPSGAGFTRASSV